MFSVYNSEVIGLEPSIESESGAVENGTQGEDVTTAHSQSQSVESYSIGVQTTEVKSVDCSKDIIKSPALIAFLRRVTPVMLEALNEDLKLDFITSDDIDNEEEEAVYLQSFDCMEESKDVLEPECGEVDGSWNFLSVLALSWNSTGNTLAVGLGHRHHEQWCQHSGIIQLYKPGRSVGDKWELSHSLSTDGCVTKLLYHPKVPFLLAYSNNSGEIYIQNVGELQGQGRHSWKSHTVANVGSVPHRSLCRLGRIADIKWLTSQQTEIYVGNTIGDSRLHTNYQVLMAVDNHGALGLWRISNDLDIYEKLVEYKIKLKRDNSDISCFDIDLCEHPNLSRDMIAVGCMSGDIVVHELGLKRLDEDFQDRNVDFGPMENHSGCVVAIKLSENCITSLGADGEIRIYNITNKHSDTYRMPAGAVVPQLSMGSYGHHIFAATAKWSDKPDNPKYENIKLGDKAVKILNIPLESFQKRNMELSKEDVGLSTSLTFNNHRFPENAEIKSIWLKNMHIRDWQPTLHSRLCSKHFEENCFKRTLYSVNLLPDAVPTIFPTLPKYLQTKFKEPRVPVGERVHLKRKMSAFQRPLAGSVSSDAGIPRTSKNKLLAQSAIK